MIVEKFSECKAKRRAGGSLKLREQKSHGEQFEKGKRKEGKLPRYINL